MVVGLAQESARIVVPLGCVYTPLKETTDLHTLPYEPVTCKKCSGILNPYARVDYRSKVWVCPICFNRNNFPAHYAGIDEQKLPAELIPNFTTIEYTMKRNRAPQPVFLYVVDTVTHPTPPQPKPPWIVCGGLSVTVCL